jgi:AraC-like DNA-binding protein
MKKGADISAEFSGLYIVHQNIPGKKNAKLSHPQHILFLPLSGEISVVCDGRKWAVGPGHMLYLPPATSHDFSSSPHGGERMIALLKSQSLSVEAKGVVKLPISQLAKEILFYLLLHPKTKSAKALIEVFAETLKDSLESVNATGAPEHLLSKVQDPRLKRALEVLESRLSENLAITEIAKIAGLSARNFTRLLQQETGLSPKQWLLAIRVEQAKSLLYAGVPVTEVALSVGYSSLSQFIAAFRARTGQLPSKFTNPG